MFGFSVAHIFQTTPVGGCVCAFPHISLSAAQSRRCVLDVLAQRSRLHHMSRRLCCDDVLPWSVFVPEKRN